MTYEIKLRIRENSRQGQNIEALVKTEHISREEAALKLLAGSRANHPGKANSAARRMLGAFKEDAALMDEVVKLAMQDRCRRNSAVPNA